MKKLYIDYHPKRVRVALTENGELIEYYIERATMPKLVGNIYRGKVVNVLEGMKAAFVNIGLEKNAFLYVGETLVDNSVLGASSIAMPQKLHVSPGDNVLCQVVKDHFGNKGVRISQNISLSGRLLVIMPQMSYIGVSQKITDESKRAALTKLLENNCPKNAGFIVRTEAENASDDEILLEMRALVTKWENIKKSYDRVAECSIIYEEGDLIFRTIRDLLCNDIESIIVNNQNVYRDLKENIKSIYPNKDILEIYDGSENFFDYYALNGQIDKLVKRKVVLKNGAYLIIDRTEALTVIDVNTGRFVGDVDLEDTVYKTNLIACKEIAKQLRLRNLGGIIIIDFIDMADELHRAQILNELHSCLKADRVRTSQPVMTSLGLVEITRKKTRSMIDGILLKDCPYCNGDSYVFSEEYVIMKVREALISLFNDTNPSAAIVSVHPDVCSKLFTLRYLERDCATIWKGKRIYLIPDKNMHAERFTVKGENAVIITLPDDARLLF